MIKHLRRIIIWFDLELDEISSMGWNISSQGESRRRSCHSRLVPISKNTPIVWSSLDGANRKSRAYLNSLRLIETLCDVFRKKERVDAQVFKE